MFFYRLPVLIVSLLLFWGCSSNESNEKEEVSFNKIEILNGWARPGAEGMMSAVYLTISNKTSYQDTLTGVSSDAAQNAEVHESYKGENGMSAMRPAPNSVIKSGDKLYLQPAGLHIMLIKLNNDLTPGDSVNIQLEFKRAGIQTIQLPVKAQN